MRVKTAILLVISLVSWKLSAQEHETDSLVRAGDSFHSGYDFENASEEDNRFYLKIKNIFGTAWNEQMKELTEQLQYQSIQLQQQSAQLQQQTEQLTELQEIIAAKDVQIAALTARIEELTHKKNSGNSSKPPSSERLNKPVPKSLRTKSGKTAGGQPGHKGSGMKIDREPDEVIEHRPIQCEGCPHAGACKLRCCETRYEYEAVVETKLIAHKVLGCKACVLTGEATQGTFPQHITGAKQYGPGVAGLAVSLLTIGYMSVDRVQKLLKSLRIPVSRGAIQDMLVKAARLVKAPVERIRQTVTQLPVAHYDETGWRVAGKLHWLHCACNEQWRYYTVQEKRGQEGISDMGVLPNASGVAVDLMLLRVVSSITGISKPM